MHYLYFRDDSTLSLIEKIRLRLKTVETRPRNVLKSIVGERVGLVVTLPNRKRFLFGYATVGEPRFYNSMEEFIEDFNRHRIDWNSPWFKSKGCGYELKDIEIVPYQPAPARLFGNRSYYCA